jgi:hypothetical protein
MIGIAKSLDQVTGNSSNVPFLVKGFEYTIQIVVVSMCYWCVNISLTVAFSCILEKTFYSDIGL